MQRGLKTVDGEVGPLVLNALVSDRATVLGTHRPTRAPGPAWRWWDWHDRGNAPASSAASKASAGSCSFENHQTRTAGR